MITEPSKFISKSLQFLAKKKKKVESHFQFEKKNSDFQLYYKFIINQFKF